MGCKVRTSLRDGSWGDTHKKNNTKVNCVQWNAGFHYMSKKWFRWFCSDSTSSSGSLLMIFFSTPFFFLNRWASLNFQIYLYTYIFSSLYVNLKNMWGMIVICSLKRKQPPFCIWLETHWMCWLKEIYGRKCIYQVHTWGRRTSFI